MPAAYSSDLRERVLAACEAATQKRAEIAELFQISEPTLYNWLRQHREEGRTTAKPHAGGPAPQIGPEEEECLREIVEQANDLTLAEYRERLRQRCHLEVSPSTISRALTRLGLPRKKRRSGPLSRREKTSRPHARSFASR
jgi:transposase